MNQWVEDFRWALIAMRARRWRRRLLFSERQRFDDAFRPRLKDATIAYPDAFYHAGGIDLLRAIAANENWGAIMSGSKWRPIQEHAFPWEPHDLLLACFYLGPESELKPEVAIFEATCSKGDYFEQSAGRAMGMTTLLENGWTPYAWLDVVPPHVPSEDDMHNAVEHFRGRLGGLPATDEN